jgi:uncharacterized spore protein YtfJ
VNEAEAAAAGPLRDIVAALADRVGGRVGVGAIFGDPVERDGVTVIPVGAVRWGFGGGGGRGGQDGEEGEGSGGGGGASANPVGYIEVGGGTARFHRIGPPFTPGALIAGAFALMLTLRALRSLVR